MKPQTHKDQATLYLLEIVRAIGLTPEDISAADVILEGRVLTVTELERSDDGHLVLDSRGMVKGVRRTYLLQPAVKTWEGEA